MSQVSIGRTLHFKARAGRPSKRQWRHEGTTAGSTAGDDVRMDENAPKMSDETNGEAGAAEDRELDIDTFAEHALEEVASRSRNCKGPTYCAYAEGSNTPFYARAAVPNARGFHHCTNKPPRALNEERACVRALGGATRAELPGFEF